MESEIKNEKYKKGDLVWVNINSNYNLFDADHYEGPAIITYIYEFSEYAVTVKYLKNNYEEVYYDEIIKKINFW
jgi:hypothetical protein